jgi:hypothetical protein
LRPGLEGRAGGKEWGGGRRRRWRRRRRKRAVVGVLDYQVIQLLFVT